MSAFIDGLCNCNKLQVMYECTSKGRYAKKLAGENIQVLI